MNATDLENPRRLKLVCHLFAEGVVGHFFSRALAPNEAELLRAIVEKHGSCIFTTKDHAPIGAWLCTCLECEPMIAILAGEAKISIIAHRVGEKNFVMINESELEIQIQTMGTYQRWRIERDAQVAAQVSAQVGGRVAMAVLQAQKAQSR